MTARTIASIVLCAAALALPATAYADGDVDPCADSVVDPIVTPIRERWLDVQRAACLRDEDSAGIAAHALIDTPGFRGQLGADAIVGRRMVIGKAHELSVQLRVLEFAFVQNAVNKVTHTGFGPLILGGAAGGSLGRGARAALVLRTEIPFTRDDRDTLRTSTQLAGVVTAALSPRLTLHARLGGVGTVAMSSGGTAKRLGLVSGGDLAWHVRPRLALHAGTEVMAGWAGGLDHVLARAGVHWRVRGDRARLRIGAGVPVAGNERTNAILDLALVLDR
jgi:hypothetical protein